MQAAVPLDLSTHPVAAKHPQQPSSRLQACVDWLLAGPHPEPVDIRSELLHQRASKTRTLTVAIFASLLTAVIAAALTGATWAYVWVAAELVLGSVRIWLMRQDVAKAKAAQRTGTTIAPIWAGLASVIMISTGCYLCVTSGVLPLMLIAGIGIAILVGGISSRNAGTPRYGALLICILMLPYAVATILSPIPYLFLVGLQAPLYTAGMIFLLLENHKVLLELHRSEHSNRQMAHHDLLTGLPNRARNQKLFTELLAGPDAEAARSKLTVFCLDLDGFKAVNDGLGHGAGDAVLIEVAKRLRTCIREVDFACRLGGDEFVVLLPHISEDDAIAVARRIIADIAEPFACAPGMPIGVSIGIAAAPRDGNTADELLSAADRAMYEAKRRGKGGFVVHLPSVEAVGLVPAMPADHGFAARPTNDNSRAAVN